MTLGDIDVWHENWLEQTGQRPPMTMNGSRPTVERVTEG